MTSPEIVVLTDRPDRARQLAHAASALMECRIVGAEEMWTNVNDLQGVIADISLDRCETKRCLKALSVRRGSKSVPLIYLNHIQSDSILCEAKRLGATLCLSVLANPSLVVAALFRQIAPEKSLTDLFVSRSVTRAAVLLTRMLEAASTGRVDLNKLDEAIDPILRALSEGGLWRWLNVMQAHDSATVRHCLHVAGLVANFATYLGLSQSDQTTLVRAALVHDVGKAQIPLTILNKPGTLDSSEMAVMRTHAAIGHQILVASGMADPLVLSATRHHHEMLDGSGYPDSLCGTEIGDIVRLLTISDIYAALTEVRPYRPAMPQAEALCVLRKMAGSKLERPLVEAFAASLSQCDLLNHPSISRHDLSKSSARNAAICPQQDLGKSLLL